MVLFIIFPLKVLFPITSNFQSVKGTSGLRTHCSNTDSGRISNVVATAILYAFCLGYNSTPTTRESIQ